jgi:DNA repair protein RadD
MLFISISIFISPEAYQGGADLSTEWWGSSSPRLASENVNTLAQAALPPGKPSPASVDWLDVLPPQADCLRPYQREQLAKVAGAMHGGYKRILVQLPTGGGKTHLIAALVAAAILVGLRVLILATRTRLVRQLHERLVAFEVRHGVVAAPLPELLDHSASVQIASVDTLHRRALVDERIPLPGADVVIFDEAHFATAETRLRILQSYPAALRIGFTATPARKSGRSLGAAFDCLIQGPTVRELTAAGTLVPLRIFNTPVVTQKELRALPKDTDNDFATAALGELLSRPKLVGDVVSNWLRIANGKRTLCFAVNKAHAGALLDSFRRQGIAAELLTDQDDEATREEVIARLESGATSVVVNCFLMSYGVDIPAVECIVLARPTRSLTMYLQMVGRGMRPAPGKTDCIVIDHGHVVENLGLPQSDFGWTLDTSRNVSTEALKANRRNSSEETARTCRQCAAMWLTSEQGHSCPSCGWTPAPKSRPIAVQEADLQELADQEAAIEAADERVAKFYRMACGWDMKRSGNLWKGSDPQTGKPRANKRRFVAWLRTRERFNLPDTPQIPKIFWALAPMEPSAETAGWLKFALIRWARGRGKKAA